MAELTKASEISPHVYLGPTPDPALPSACLNNMQFDVMIEASELAHLPSTKVLKTHLTTLAESKKRPLQMEFPSSGSIMPPTWWLQTEADHLLETCRWIYGLTHPNEHFFKQQRKEAGIAAKSDLSRPQNVLIHSADGYTDATLLGLAYFMYAHQLPMHDALIQLHRDKGRNFFAYSVDINLLASLQSRILLESSLWNGGLDKFDHVQEPKWLTRFDGSLPSRILPYMYLGNIGHANNPELLQQLGITRILSVGEPTAWHDNVKKRLDWPEVNQLLVDQVQDNGMDSLCNDFARCLDFLGMWCRL